MNIFERYCDSSQAKKKAEERRYGEVTSEFGHFVAKTSGVTSAFLEGSDPRSSKEQVKTELEAEMRSYLSEHIEFPEDNLYYPPPEFKSIFNGNYSPISATVRFGYDRYDASTGYSFATIANDIHERMQRNPFPKGKYEVGFDYGWQDYVGFYADSARLKDLHTVSVSMRNGRANYLNLQTGNRRFPNQYLGSAHLDIAGSGELSERLDAIAARIDATYAILILNHEDTDKLGGVVVPNRDSDFSNRFPYNIWSHGLFLVPHRSLVDIEKEFGQLLRGNQELSEYRSRFVGVIKQYSGSEFDQFVQRGRDIKNVVESTYEPETAFSARARSEYGDAASYGDYMPTHGHIDGIRILPHRKARTRNELFIGSRLTINCDLSDPSLFHLQSQAAQQAGIQFI